MTFSTSQRIKIIKEISLKIANDEWIDIDLMLTSFKLPIRNDWSGTKSSYAIEMIKDADNDVLAEIAEHFDIISSNKIEDETIKKAPLREDGTFTVFISHLASHRKFSGELKKELLKYGIAAFVAHDDIEPTLEWQNEIEKGLVSCDALVALLHPDFHKSNWTDQEIGFAMGRGVAVLAVRLGQDPYGFIGKFQAFNGASKSPSDLALELFDALRKHKQTKLQMQELVLNLLENSRSFDSARIRTGYLEDFESWDVTYTPRIEAAIAKNDQISGSWKVPDRLSDLMKKWN